MTVYIEYAFLQNFLFDGLLLWLSLCVAGVKPKWVLLVFSSVLGACFALIYPFILLNDTLLFCLKTAVASLLTLTAYGRIKTRKDRGRYALTTVFFFAFTFIFGGVTTYFGIKTAWGSLVSFLLLTIGARFIIKTLQRRNSIRQFTYPCVITFKGRMVNADGFFDSGNGAEKFGVPVCFLSPDLAYDLFDGFEKHAQTFRMTTLAGEKETRLYLGGLKMYDGCRLLFRGEVYFASSVHMVRKEYKLLLNRALMEGEQG